MEEKKNYKIFLSPAGAIIAAICFFLPWVKFSCMRQTKYVSGADLGGVFWVVFGAAILIILSFIYFKNQNQLEKVEPIVFLSTLVSFIIMIWKYIEISDGIKTQFGKITLKDLGFSIQFGLIFTIMGFIISLIGTAFLKNESTNNCSNLNEIKSDSSLTVQNNRKNPGNIINQSFEKGDS